MDKEQSYLTETLQDQVNGSILHKRLRDKILHKHYGVNQKKDCQLHKCSIK